MLTISLYFSYIYGLKKKYYLSVVFAFHAFASVMFLLYYIYMGNPDRAVERFGSYMEFLLLH